MFLPKHGKLGLRPIGGLCCDQFLDNPWAKDTERRMPVSVPLFLQATEAVCEGSAVRKAEGLTPSLPAAGGQGQGAAGHALLFSVARPSCRP
jgi:hypothetical protein